MENENNDLIGHGNLSAHALYFHPLGEVTVIGSAMWQLIESVNNGKSQSEWFLC